jgi:large subunit ribosomal protein L4
MAHALTPRNYAQKTPKKMVRLALCSALSDRAAEGKVVVIDEWSIDAPKTKDARAALKAIEVSGKVLLVLGENDEAVWKSFRNLKDVRCQFARELNAYDVLVSDYVVFTRETLPGATPSAETPVAVESKPAAKTAEKTADKEEVSTDG